MSEALAQIIREEIHANGPIPFSRWMELCLYHPEHGYYVKPGRKTGHGGDADFVTPPTLHPFFGKAIGKELAEAWAADGKPAEWRVLELGGGEGDLARNAIAWLDLHEPRLASGIAWIHAELNRAHRARQATSDRRIRSVPAVGWGVGPSDGQAETQAQCILACEVVDAIPFDVFAWRGGMWEKLHAALEGQGFAEAWMAGERPPAWVWPDRAVPEQGRQAVSHTMLGPWISQVPSGSTRRLLLVDYGQAGPISRGAQAVRAYCRHQTVPWTVAPGDADLTASVDFTQTRFWAHGFREAAFETLEEFLLRHGILEELNGIDRRAPEGASSYLRLRQLLLPTGLGHSFKVQRLDRVPPHPASP